MNKIWVLMLLSGVFCYGFTSLSGTADPSRISFSESLFESCEEAIYFVIGLAGIMGLWSGFMNIAKGSGLIHSISIRCRRLMDFLFPEEKDEDTLMLMLMGFITNILGAGNSATVFSLQAMKKMDESNPHKEYASNQMCMFASVNMSMLQLVPVTIVQIRAQSGSKTPEDIIIPSIISGLLATVASIAVCKYCESRHHRVLPLRHHNGHSSYFIKSKFSKKNDTFQKKSKNHHSVTASPSNINGDPYERNS